MLLMVRMVQVMVLWMLMPMARAVQVLHLVMPRVRAL